MKSFPILCLAALLGASSHVKAATATFSFIDDTWTNGGSTQSGYLDGATSGTLSKDGVTLTFQSSFTGTAIAATRNLTLDNGNPTGFVLGTNADPNDLNGELVNFQRWDFSFSQPVILNTLILDDIDSDRTNPAATDGFRDGISAEGFSTFTPGALGSGTDVEFVAGSGLIQGVIAAGSGQSLNYVIAAPADNPNNDPIHRASLSFGTTPVSSFSIYSFSDRSQSHRVSLFQGKLEVTVVPEPSVALLGLLGLPAVTRRRRSV